MQPRVGNIEIEVFPIMKHVASILAVIVATTTSVSAAETRLSIEGPSGVLQGTLAAPDGGLKAPVAIIIPGSGPTDRDGNNPLGVTAGSYRLLAEALAAKGVSTIRIDKRGMFGSIAAAADADNVRMTDYAADVRAWGQEAQKRTSARCAWLMGHSEGSLIALITAQQPEGICGLILVAGAGRKMGDILREQLKANPANAPILPQALAAITELEAGRRVDVSGMHPALMALFRPSVQGFVIDQMSYDPAALLRAGAGSPRNDRPAGLDAGRATPCRRAPRGEHGGARGRQSHPEDRARRPRRQFRDLREFGAADCAESGRGDCVVPRAASLTPNTPLVPAKALGHANILRATRRASPLPLRAGSASNQKCLKSRSALLTPSRAAA
jgi:pimeloyl-ACP methyl ester carboxylesterase